MAKQIADIMNKKYNPRDLAREQYNALKEHTIEILREIIDCIDNGNYEDVIKDMTFESPSGDCMGMDNTVINFGFDKNQKDIRQVLNHLSFLADYADREIELDETYCDGNNYLDIDD